MAAYLLAVDVGTSSLKAVLYDRSGAVIGSATERYDYRAAQPGWAEIDPETWWQAFRAAIAALGREGFSLAGLAGIAFTGQMHTAVLLDAQGQPLEPTILWLDRRAAAETEELTDRLQLPPYQINSAYTLPKLLWLHRHRPDLMDKVHTILWPKDYLRYRLTGVICTDLTEPGGAVLLDWQKRDWAIDRLEPVGLDRSVLPPIRPADDIVGPPRPDLAQELGLNPRAEVIVGLGDVAALIGGAPPQPGRVVCSLGSSSMLFMALAEDQQPHDPDHRLYIYPFLPPYRLLGGVSSTTGAALKWIYDNVALEADFVGVMREAAQLPPGADGVCFIPYLAGERSPYWLDSIRGGFYGLALGHDSRYLVRAVMEGIAYSMRHLLDIYEEIGAPVRELALAGGGTQTPGLSQIIADVCQYDAAIYTESETVTRVLFALSQAALQQTDFIQTLVNAFPRPEIIPCRREKAASYEPGYQRYRRFAEFARQEGGRN